MKRMEISLHPHQINQLLMFDKLPINFREKLENSNQQQVQNIFTNEEELEKILDLLPPPHLSDSQQQELRESLTEDLKKMN